MQDAWQTAEDIRTGVVSAVDTVAAALARVAELDGEMAQAREHQVQLLAVERSATQLGRRLHEHDLPVAMLVTTVDVRTELVAEHPERGIIVAGHGRQCPG